MPWDRLAGRAARVARRAVALRCPRCGGTRLFPGGPSWPDRWFRMARECALCGLRYERAQGYFVGAIYVNYGVTTLLAVGGAFLLWARTGIDPAAQLGFWVPFVVVFPVWFFRYSRSLWLALEYFVNPEP
jgi:uncharacterized protein (DUF983 family)